MSASELITLSRACEVIEIPSGTRGTLPAGTVVKIMQSLAGSYTVATDRGYMYRVEAKDTDALRLSNAAMAQEPAVREGPFSEQSVAKTSRLRGATVTESICQSDIELSWTIVRP